MGIFRWWSPGHSACRDSFHGGQKAVATAGEGLDKTRTRRGVAQGLPQFVDDGVEAVVEVNKSIGRPQPLADFFAGDQISRALQQHEQNLEGLLLQAQAHSGPAQLAGIGVSFVRSEAEEYL